MLTKVWERCTTNFIWQDGKVKNIELQTKVQDNALEKDVLMDLQKKLAEFLKSKGKCKWQIERMTWKMFLLAFQKRLVKNLNKSMWWDKEEWKRNQILYKYLIN